MTNDENRLGAYVAVDAPGPGPCSGCEFAGSPCYGFPCSGDVRQDGRNVIWVKAQDRPANALDSQEGGDHYKKMGEYQPWAVLEKWLTPEELKGYAKGTAIAYLAREADKGGRLDIKKAVHTLELYLELTGGSK